MDFYENGWFMISILFFKCSRLDWDWVLVSFRCFKKVLLKVYFLVLKDELVGFVGEI